MENEQTEGSVIILVTNNSVDGTRITVSAVPASTQISADRLYSILEDARRQIVQVEKQAAVQQYAAALEAKDKNSKVKKA